jgi:hypothetical protein
MGQYSTNYKTQSTGAFMPYSHYDRRLSMSDARIEPFKGLVDGER